MDEGTDDDGLRQRQRRQHNLQTASEVWDSSDRHHPSFRSRYGAMSRGHSVLRTMGQMALTSPSPSAASSSAAHSVRFIFTTAARSEEEKMQRRGPPRQPSSFGSGPGGSGRRPPMGGRQRRRSSDRGDREDRDAPQRGDAQNGRFRRARGAPRNRNDEEKEGNPVTISEGETFIDWYHSRGYKAFALPPEGRGPFWIAATPFPSNPSFDPPPPISQRYKDAMWALHLKDPKEYNLRFLSQHYGLTLERTHAVLRLKALEAEMTVKVSSRFDVLQPSQDESKKHIRLVLKTHLVVRSFSYI